MRFLSFKILVLCILLPPVLYIVSVHLLEGWLRDRYAGQIEDIYTGDTRPLLDGSVRLEDAVSRNIDRFLKSRVLIPLGVRVNVAVITGQGRILYPAVFRPAQASLLPPDPAQVAAENYTLMNQGLRVNVDVKIRYDSLISGLLLGFFVFCFLLLLYVQYKRAAGRIRRAELEKGREMARLREQEKENAQRLQALVGQRQKLNDEFEHLKGMLATEKSRAERNENEMIDEIVALEEQLKRNLEQQDAQQEEIEQLREKIQQFEKGRRKGDRQKIKAAAAVKKRFNALYKNLSVNDRAISGFVDLSDDLKLKAEELIHQLNEDPALVTVKRKVFGKKGHATVLEVIFGYKGRLYFRNLKDKRVEILAVGTKNTQARELEFLAGL